MNAISCGGVVVVQGKILLLYKYHKRKYDAWVLPKGTVEPGEKYNETALREVFEESGVEAEILKYVAESYYTFTAGNNIINKKVKWFLMTAKDFKSTPQASEYFIYSAYYNYKEALHLLKYPNEKKILKSAYKMYNEITKYKYDTTDFDCLLK